jgi:hypothetical protein
MLSGREMNSMNVKVARCWARLVKFDTPAVQPLLPGLGARLTQIEPCMCVKLACQMQVQCAKCFVQSVLASNYKRHFIALTELLPLVTFTYGWE